MKIGKKLFTLAGLIISLAFCVLVWLHEKSEMSEVNSLTNIILHNLLICIVILGWVVKLAWYLLRKNSEKKLVASVISATNKKTSSNDAMNQQNFIRNVEKTIKELKKQRSLTGAKIKPLHKLPWYIISGPPGYGKTQLVKKSGLSFPLLKSFKHGNINKDDGMVFESWVTEEAVFLELSKAKNLANWDANTYNKVWMNVLKSLKKYKDGEPINGVIMVVDISYFMGSHIERQQKIKGTREHIKEIYEQLKFKYPVYVMVSKCDALQGFSEYFENLSVAEREEALGFDILLNDNNIGSLDTILTDKFDFLLKKLNDRLPWLLQNEADVNKKALITFFPQQLYLLKNRFLEVFKNTFSPQKLYELIDLRGVYFYSATQEATMKYNILDSIISEQSQLFPTKYTSQTQVEQSSFLKNVFTKIILPEFNPFAIEKHNSRIAYWFKATLGIAAAILMLNVFNFAYTYYNAYNLTLKTQKDILLFQQNLSNYTPNDNSFKPFLTLMAPLKASLDLYAKHRVFSFHHHQRAIIKNSLHAAMRSNLNTLFMPKILQRLRYLLNQNQQNATTLYAIFKAYLFLGNPKQLPKEWLTTVMYDDWQQDSQYSSQDRLDLNNYLQLALQQATPIALDPSVIENIKSVLRQNYTAENIYENIKNSATTANVKAISLSEALGKNAAMIFTNDLSKKINLFYTAKEFSELYVSPLAERMNQLSAEKTSLATNLNINFSLQAMAHAINQIYLDDYVQYWQTLIASFKVTSLDNLNQAITVLNTLKENNSPLLQFLMLIKTNNDFLDANNKISLAFYTLTHFMNSDSQNNYAVIVKTITDLAQYITNIQLAKNPNQAAFSTLKMMMQGEINDPISLLRSQALSTPEPIKRWLLQITQDISHILMTMAYTYVNEQWAEEVVSKYKNVNTLFPLNNASETDITETDFANLFKQNGVINTFFQNYLNPFINKEKTMWTWRQVNGEYFSNDVIVLQQLRNIYRVSSVLYPQNTAQLFAVTFTLQPLLLSDNAAALQMQIGNQNLTYQHGPLQTTTFAWPVEGNPQIQLTFRDFENNQFSKTFTGYWALIKLFNASEIKKSATANNYILKLTVNNYTANFTLTISNPEVLQMLALLNNLQIPNSI